MRMLCLSPFQGESNNRVNIVALTLLSSSAARIN